MRRPTLRLMFAAIVLCLLGLTWLFAGRVVSIMLDCVLTIRPTPLPTTPLAVDDRRFLIGPRAWDLTRRGASPLQLSTDSRNRLVVSDGKNAIVLGAITRRSSGDGGVQYDFSPESGDDVSFVRTQSAISWPTPWNIRVVGPTSSWRRNMYYRLKWVKPGGQTFEIEWRDQKLFYAGTGWVDAYVTEVRSVKIDADPLVDAAVEYVSRTKGWRREEYRMENRGLDSANASAVVIAVIYLTDEEGGSPGGGKSVELLVDAQSRRVLKEIGGQ